MNGFVIMVDRVANDLNTVDEAYQAWKIEYPEEFYTLEATARRAWNTFRLAVSKKIGRGLYFNELRFRRPVIEEESEPCKNIDAYSASG